MRVYSTFFKPQHIQPRDRHRSSISFMIFHNQGPDFVFKFFKIKQKTELDVSA